MKNICFNKTPHIAITGCDNQAWQGYDAILPVLAQQIKTMSQPKRILTVECYPGINQAELLGALKEGIQPDLIILADDASLPGEEITRRIQDTLTEERVFGVMSHYRLSDFFPQELLARQRARIDDLAQGIVLIYGVGASLIHQGDVLVYADLCRWEIQKRFRRAEQCNWKADNYGADILEQYKRGFFFEWRAADRLKKELYDQIDFFLDTNVAEHPKMITGQALIKGLQQVVSRPFSMVPYFDPGVWGGQWMKEVCGLPPDAENYAWSFNGVPEENSLLLHYGGVQVEMPAVNAVLRYPKELLGDQVHARFGTEFPIRFDFLDTMGGQNLSLQVHPLTEYIQDRFGMHYTQDESYYILDAQPDAEVYLGLQKGVDPQAMRRDLEAAARGEGAFPADKYVNRFPIQKHDHVLIPAGTVHCSAAGSMVLEISATPYIFTFKLWDWGRLGLDGKPRPVHIEHGMRSIQWERDTDWVQEQLVDRVVPLRSADGWREERTGLHERQFIDTRRYWFQKPVTLETMGSVHMLMLVEGSSAVVESPVNAFEPFPIHYAQTFIIPACVGAYRIRPDADTGEKELAVIQASVRTGGAYTRHV